MARHKPGSVNIGTSGWNYNHWKQNFYPQELKPQEWLDFYQDRFDTVEINNSFYRLPPKKTFKNWSNHVDKNFHFAIKANRYITHRKCLKDAKEPLKRFTTTIDTLKSKTGPVLFQLPPNWKLNVERLKDFLSKLDKKHRYAIEFRNEDWHKEEVYELLKKHNIAFCIYDFDKRMSPEVVTADWVYLRFHGPDGKYQGKYDREFINKWARKIEIWRKEGKDVYCYFDNDDQGYAVVNAKELREKVGEK